MDDKLKKTAAFWEKYIRNMAILTAVILILIGSEQAVYFLILWISLVVIRFAYFVWQCLKCAS